MLAAASQYREFDAGAVSLKVADSETMVRNLDCNKIRNTFAIKQQPWRASFAGYVKQYYAREQTRERKLGEGNR